MDETGFPLPTKNPAQWVVYLTARCNFACDYCIQKGQIVPGEKRKPWGRYDELSGAEWIRALNDMPVRPQHTLILTGGEPSIHRDFYEIAAGLEGYKLDLTSNLTLDIDRLARSMRAAGRTFHSSFHSYHPNFMEPETFVERAIQIRDSGAIDHPVFSVVNLDQFPHFRNDTFDARFLRFCEVATARGLQFQRNEFRGNHMGAPYTHQTTQAIDCTSAWVNIAPDGGIYNCQFHLESRKNSFGNVTQIGACKPMPRFGTFFHCDDFGNCDSCHENSGHGAFRDANGVVFARTAHDPRIYLEWMKPAAIAEVAGRYLEQGNRVEAEHAFDVAIDKLAAEADGGAADAWSEVGMRLWAAESKDAALDAMLRAIERGAREAVTIAAALELGHETSRAQTVRDRIEPFVAQATIDAIETELVRNFDR